MIFLDQLGDIYWHARFYHQFFELAATGYQPILPKPISDEEDGKRETMMAFFGNRLSKRRLRSAAEAESQVQSLQMPGTSYLQTVEDSCEKVHQAGEDRSQGGNANIIFNLHTNPNKEPPPDSQLQETHVGVLAEHGLDDYVSPVTSEEWQFETLLEDYRNFYSFFPSA